MSGHQGGTDFPFVRVPTAFFDEQLPRLSGAETKVFLTVVRQTLGRRELVPSGKMVHRRRDWLSHAQLVCRTGYGSEAVSGAVKRLVNAGLIVVEAADGTPLPTAGDRRRHLGRLYYRLGEKWITAPSSRPDQPKTTIERRTKREAT